MAGYGQAIGGIFSGMGETLPSAAKTLTDEARSRRNEALALPVAQYNKAVAEDNLKKLTTMHKKEDLFRKSDIAKYYWEAGETFGFIQPGATEINELTREKIHEFMLGKGAPYMTTRIMELYNKNRESVGKFGPLKQNTQAELDQIDEELSQYPQSVIGADEKLAKKMQKRQELQKQMAFYNQQENIENQGLKSLEQPLRMYMDYGARDIIKSTWPLEKQDTAIAMYEEWVRGDKGAINPLENKGAVDARIARDKEEAVLRQNALLGTAEMQTFEGVTGFKREQRGTPTYRKAYEEWMLARKEQPYKTQEPKRKGAITKQTYVWIPNEINPVTNQKGVYRSTTSNMTPEQNNEQLMSVELKDVPSSTSTALASARVAYSGLADAEKLYYEKLQGVTGPLSGRAAKAYAIIADSPEVAQLLQNLGRTLASILRAESGLVVSDRERAFYEKEIMPLINKPQKNFERLLTTTKKWIQDVHDYNVQLLEETNHIVPQRILPALGKSKDYGASTSVVGKEGIKRDSKSSNPFDRK